MRYSSIYYLLHNLPHRGLRIFQLQKSNQNSNHQNQPYSNSNANSNFHIIENRIFKSSKTPNSIDSVINFVFTHVKAAIIFKGGLGPSINYVVKKQDFLAVCLKSIPNNLESNMRLFLIFCRNSTSLACKNQSELSCSILIGSDLLNVYIFAVKFLQKKIETVSYLILCCLIWTLHITNNLFGLQEYSPPRKICPRTRF